MTTLSRGNRQIDSKSRLAYPTLLVTAALAVPAPMVYETKGCDLMVWTPPGKRFAIVGKWFIIPFATLAWVEAEHFYMQERMPLSWSQLLKPELQTVVFQCRTAERQRADLSVSDSKV
jgi:hypothetical protein